MLVPLIPTRVHGMLDYGVGLLLVIAPWLFAFSGNSPATMIMVVMGLAAIVYSLLTNYELGAVHAIPMNGHLIIDLLSGLLLVASPWLFGFADRIAWPHVTFGLLEIGVVMLSSKVPGTRGGTPGSFGTPHAA